MQPVHPPPGWAAHPQAPGYFYNLANPQDVRPVSAFVQQPAQYPAPLGPAPTHAHPQQAGVPFHYSGVQDIDAFIKNHDAQVRLTKGWSVREKSLIWIDFEKVNRVGDESHLMLRLLPDPLDRKPPMICLPVARHAILVQYVPNYQGTNQVVWYNCLNMPGGPGNCPLCAAIEDVEAANIQGGTESMKRLKQKTTICWQAINLNDLHSHWVEDVDSEGNAKRDAQGQPVLKVVPGIIRMKQKLANSVINLMRVHKDPTHLSIGWPVLLVKKKTGPNQMNVEYSAINGEKGPIDPQLYPIVQGCVDLEKELKFFMERSKLNEVADEIRARFGVARKNVAQVPGAPGGDGWLVHPQNPQFEYNPQTGAVREKQAAPPAPPALPPVPQLPAAPPALPGYPPGGPPATMPHQPPQAAPVAGGPPGLPQPAPMRPGLPPPGAPGLTGLPQLPAPGLAPPPPPGMPPGTHPSPQAPPGPPPGAPPASPAQMPLGGTQGPVSNAGGAAAPPMPAPPGPPPGVPGLPPGPPPMAQGAPPGPPQALPPAPPAAPPPGPPGPPTAPISPEALEQQLAAPPQQVPDGQGGTVPF